MTTMATLSQMQRKVEKVHPVLIAIAVLGVALAAYFIYLGIRFYDARGEIDAYESRIRQITAARGVSSAQSTAEESYVVQQAKLDATQALFSYTDTDALVKIILSTAEESGVNVKRVNVPISDSMKLPPVTYVVQPLAVVLEATAPQAYDFLQRLSQHVPVMEVTNVSLSGEEGTVQIRLQFYLAPVVEGQ